MLNYLVVLRDFSWMLYAGPLIGFGLILSFMTLMGRDDRKAIVDHFCLWGPVFGLSMGIAIYSSLGAYWIEHGHFWLSIQGDSNLMFTIGVTFGFVLWVSNILLEIWTLDSIRKAGSANIEPDPKALTRAIKHIQVQSLLATVTTLFCTYSMVVT